MNHKAQGKPLEQPQLQCPATLSCCPEAMLIIQLLRNFDDTATSLFVNIDFVLLPQLRGSSDLVKQGDYSPYVVINFILY
jgi:hypothetical protein